MTMTKRTGLKRVLSVLLALTLCLGMASVNVFAASTAEPTTPIEKIDVPLKDGVYYANVNLLMATNPNQYSMGNASLRGSETFKQKQPNDTYSKSVIVVKDNKATAIVEFMPMGFIGMYGFMMELESVDAKYLTQFGGVYDGNAVFTPADVLTRHMTSDGETVYDNYNDPESSDCFNGNKKRPAGFGHTEVRTVDISNKPYSHILALDVTPIRICDDEGSVPSDISEYTRDNSAYVHVFVPVMFSISESSGDQYARMLVDWETAEKIENPENNLSYALWNAKQIKQSNYTNASYTALQNVIGEVTTELENIWPNKKISMNGTGFNAQPKLEQKEFDDSERAEMAEKINKAVAALEAKGEKETLDTAIARAEKISEELYTAESYAEMKNALDAAVKVKSNDDAGVSEVNGAVKALNDKIEALVYKAADYSAVDSAVKKIPADLSVYTDESAAAVKAAEKAIVRGKNITEQAAVDTMASNIEAAVAALKLKASSGSLDKNNLKDGVYSVQGEMIKLNRQEKSMSNEAVNHTVKLTVENGRYYITLDFKGLHYLNRFGYLAKLSYYDNGYAYGQYGKIEGTLIPAQVLSTQKNADGSDLFDEFNKAGGSSEGLLYPDQIKFPLVTDALGDPDGYVPLHVFVPVMEDISAGTGDQDVLLKLDFSTLAATTEDDPAFKPQDNDELSPAVDYTDAATGVKVYADKGVFEEGVKIVVSEIKNGTAYDNAVSALADIGKDFKLYSISFLNKDGNEASPNGTVNITFPVSAGSVYRIENGNKVLVKGTAGSDGYTVVTKSAGSYALTENGNSTSPRTGDSGSITLAVILMLAAVAMLAAIAFSGKRKRLKGE